MNIGIEIDDVIADKIGYYLELGESYFGVNMNMKDFLIKQKGFDVTPECFKVFSDLFDAACYNAVNVYSGAVSWIKKAKGASNSIYIVTSRGFKEDGTSDSDTRVMTVNWLEKNNIIYDGIFFTQNKIELVSKLGITFMCESNPSVISELLNVTDCNIIAKEQPYNVSSLCMKSFRVRSFRDWTAAVTLMW